jgi:hypothetical protein
MKYPPLSCYFNFVLIVLNILKIVLWNLARVSPSAEGPPWGQYLPKNWMWTRVEGKEQNVELLLATSGGNSLKCGSTN